jgi:membrane protease subunit HflK
MTRDPYRGLLQVMIALGCAGVLGGVVVGAIAPACFDAVLVCGIAVAMVAGVLIAGSLRAGWRPATEAPVKRAPVPPDFEGPPEPLRPPPTSPIEYLASLQRVIGVFGLVAVGVEMLILGMPDPAASRTLAVIGGTFALVAAIVCALAAGYFSRVDELALPEGRTLAQAARSGAWAFVGLAASQVALRFHVGAFAFAVHLAIVLVIASTCAELLRRRPVDVQFAARLTALELTGARANVVASVLDGIERNFGIDLRSTWALAYVRQRFLVFVAALAALGWVSTSLSVVGRDERAIVERFGVPLDGPPLEPGLHAHLPWPIDRLARVEVQKVRAIQIGHEGEAEKGPEDVLWAREHAAQEYTLLVGDGHDLLTIDAALQFRIVDVGAWLYHVQNPVDALRASGYRAVMRATVNRTLEATLSENVSRLTAQIRDDIQHDADSLGLGVEIVAFTVGGMHPPVAVASEYEAVISAELGKTTAVVEAQASRNALIPAADVESMQLVARAKQDAAEAAGDAAGKAWGFRALEARYRVDPAEYRFRSRLEALERALGGRHYTIVDSRILRDGGGLWLNP